MHKRQYSDNIGSRPRTMAVCANCGCSCDGKIVGDASHSLDLQHQIEELMSRLRQSQVNMANMQTEYDDRLQKANYELLKLQEEFVKLRDRYERLMESHKRMQKINNNLENKILNTVNSSESDKTSLQNEVAKMTSKLVEAKTLICELEEENERFRSDCSLAVHLLQCKPSNFVGQRLPSLPIDLQERIKTQMTSEQLMNLRNAKPETPKLIHIPMQTFPPTAMVYSVPNPAPKDHEQDPLMVPVSLIAKVLAPPEMRQRQLRTYFCVKCKEDYPYANKETQTCVLALQDGDKHVKGAVKVHRKVRNHSNSSLESDVTFSP